MPELRRSPVPLYFQLSTHLEERILSDEFLPGDQLPNEKQIASEYAVSLVTVRGAMRVLLDKKLVVRFSGKGTFVADRMPVKRLWSIGSLEDLVATGSRSELKLLSLQLIFPPVEIADKFGLKKSQKIYAMQTIRMTDTEPFMLTDTYHPPEIGSRMKKRDFEKDSSKFKLVISIVEEVCGIKVASARQVIGIENANQETAERLDVEPGEPLLAVDREYFTEDGKLIQIARARCRADCYRYVINVSRVDENTSSENVERLKPRLVSTKN